MLIHCTSCQKKMKVADTAVGKKMRCPHCKGIVVVPAPAEESAEPPAAVQPSKKKSAAPSDETNEKKQAVQKKTPAPAASDDNGLLEGTPRKKRSIRPEPKDENEPEDEADDDALRCAKCNSAEIEKMPPNVFSRNPGFTCKKCKATMRPPGSTGVYLFAIIMGVLLLIAGVLVGIGLLVTVFTGGTIPIRGFSGAAALTMFGLVVAGWGGSQIRLPVPRNAPPFRWGLWIGVTLVLVFAILLVGGGCVFGFMYFLQEMLG